MRLLPRAAFCHLRGLRSLFARGSPFPWLSGVSGERFAAAALLSSLQWSPWRSSLPALSPPHPCPSSQRPSAMSADGGRPFIIKPGPGRCGGGLAGEWSCWAIPRASKSQCPQGCVSRLQGQAPGSLLSPPLPALGLGTWSLDWSPTSLQRPRASTSRALGGPGWEAASSRDLHCHPRPSPGTFPSPRPPTSPLTNALSRCGV